MASIESVVIEPRKHSIKATKQTTLPSTDLHGISIHPRLVSSQRSLAPVTDELAVSVVEILKSAPCATA